jgi:hypothetical protein
MVDAPKTKTKDAWTCWRNRPYATGDDQKKKTAEAFEALNLFVRRHGGAVTSPPGKTLRIEIAKNLSAKLTDELTTLGHCVMRCGSVTRVTGAPSISAKEERLTHAVPSAFCEMDVIEIRTDGK